MAKEIAAQITIKATPETVWNILTDFASYLEWNPFITRITGEQAVGGELTVRFSPPESPAVTLKPKILVYNPGKELRWLGRVLVPGLCDGEHVFQIIDNGDGTTTFVQHETLKGLMVPLLKTDKTQKGFELMNQKLKEHAEA